MNIYRYRGDTYPDLFTITDSDGSTLDITGHTFLLSLDRLRAPLNTSTRLYQLTGTIVDGPTGQVSFAPTAQQASIVGNFYYDLQMTDDLGDIKTVQTGIYSFTQDITK